jgi:tetratricopeptide (TPR) repeat protein
LYGPTNAPLWHARFELLRCELLLSRNDTRQAREILAQGLPKVEGARQLAPRYRYLEGYTLERERRFEDARGVLGDASRAARAAHDFPLLARIEMIIGQTYDHGGQPLQFVATCRRALALAEQSGDRFEHGAALNNLGMSLMKLWRIDESIGYFERALDAARAARAPFLEAAALGNLAICRTYSGDFEQALVARQQANAVFQRAGTTRLLLQGLGEAGSLHLLAGDARAAEGEMRRALALARQLNMPEEIAEWADTLAALLLRNGRLEEAASLNQEAARLARARKDDYRLARTRLNEARLEAARGHLSEAAALFTPLAADSNQPHQLRWEAHAGLAGILARRGQADAAGAAYERAITVAERARGELTRSDSAVSFQSNVIGIYQDYVDLLMERNQVERALAVADSSRAGALADDDAPLGRLDVERLRAVARGRGMAFLSYWLTPRGSRAFVVTGEGVRTVALPAGPRVSALVAEWRDVIAGSGHDPLLMSNSAGTALYAELIRPLEPLLGGAKEVLVVPDGALHLLNLETLPNAAGHPHYWLEDVGVSVAPALAALSTKAPGSAAGALLVGDPRTEDGRFPHLANAGAELDAVRRLTRGPATELRGVAATPEAYLESHPEHYRWIHFAAHARSSPANPLDSAVILSRGQGDFRLYASEVPRRPIAAELVMLSACQSAGARSFPGEGLVGFAWAFLKAGAGNVIAGLWDVDDRATLELVEQLYGGLGRGLDPAAALREAKLKLLRSGGSYAKPFYWGPWQAFTRRLPDQFRRGRAGLLPARPPR